MNRDEESVRQANQDFYRAFESLELPRMEAAWWHDGQVTCIHPGWPLSDGWPAVREGWRSIFANTDRIQFEVTDERIDVVGDLAWVICTEWLASRSQAGRSQGAVLATNVFRREGGRWRMVHHHASPFIPRTEDRGRRRSLDETSAAPGSKKGVVN